MFFEQIAYDWLVIAGVLLVVELLTFTYLFLWIGLAALVVAGVGFFYKDMPFAAQLILFAVASLVCVKVWTKYHKKTQDSIGDDKLNNRAARYVGRTVTIHEAVVNNSGKVRIDDSYWQVQGTDMPAGSKAKVTGFDGSILLVEQID